MALAHTKITAFILCLHQLMLQLGTCQTCIINGDSNGRDIPFADLGRSSPRLPSDTQAIIASYQFQCCGNISAWQTYVERSGGAHQDGAHSITFQVWRPSPAVATDGCYSLVGENVFSSISLIGNNGLVSETPAPTNVISVQPGDVVGYFTSSSEEDDDGIQLLDDDFTDERVWYHTNSEEDFLTLGAPECLFNVGPNRMLSSSTSAAPVLSISLISAKCPSSVTATPLTSTPVPTTGISNGSSSPVVLASVGAAVGLVIILLVAVTLVAVCTAKVRRKSPKYNTHPPTTSNTLNMEINGAYITTASTIPDHTHNSDELYASINEEDVKMQGNDAYSTSRHIPMNTNESYTTTISTDPNQAYAAHDMNTSQEPDEYDYVT